VTAQFRFALYVMGDSSRSRTAVRQLQELCDAQVGGGCEIEVFDVAARPDIAEERRIVATPTLDRVEPTPRIRVIGDLGPVDRLAAALDLPHVPLRKEAKR